jgi:hypothetical protein
VQTKDAVGPIEGGCQCGAVRYRLEGKPRSLAVCHCTMCQRQSGSAFGMSLAISRNAFQLLSGTLKTFNVTCDSGRIKECAFCPECGVRIYNRTEGRTSIKAGTLDDTSWLEPDAHFWTKSKQAWTPIPDGAPCFLDDG